MLRARRLGCHIILVDRRPKAPGQEHADVYESASTADKEGVLSVAVKHKVDAVMTYASDSSVPTVAYVAERLGLPGNPPAAAETIRRKDLWRAFQRENALPHPLFFIARTVGEALDKVPALTFPIVVKPVDSAGTKGQSVVHSKREVPLALDIALGASAIKQAVFENFIHTDRMEIDGDVWFHDGRLRFRHYGHNHFLKDRISNVPSGERFPGRFDEPFSAHIDDQFRKVIDRLGLRSGIMNFDALAVGNTVYIVDVGLRGGGNFVPDLIQLSTGFDMTEAAVHNAFGEDYVCPDLYRRSSAPVASYLMGSRFRLAGSTASNSIHGSNHIS